MDENERHDELMRAMAFQAAAIFVGRSYGVNHVREVDFETSFLDVAAWAVAAYSEITGREWHVG